MGVGPRVAILLLLASAACHQPARLASVQPEPAGEHCANGGVVIRTGGDDNGNGELESSEVDSESYVCAGEGGTTGHDSLADTQPIAPGAECTNGGTRVRTGIDVDDDGILDDTEVVREVVLCIPDAGPPTLVTTRYEPPGVHCARGGSAIESGVDVNANEVLDPAEVASTTFVCNGQVPTTDTVLGDFVVVTSFDVALLASVKRVTGFVFVRPLPGIDPIVAPVLEQIDGTLIIQPNATRVEMPKLAFLGGLSTQLDDSLETLALPALSTIGTSGILINADQHLADLELPALTDVQGTCVFENLFSLAALQLPSLRSTRTFVLSIDRTLVVELPVLETVDGDLGLGLRGVTSIVLPRLSRVTRNLSVGDLPLVEDIAAPVLSTVGGTLSATQLPALADLDLSALTSLGGLQLDDLPSLDEGAAHLALLTDLPIQLSLANLSWTSLDHFSSLVHAGTVSVVAMPVMTAVDLPSLESAGMLAIARCSALTRLDGFAELQQVTGDVSISFDDNLVGVAGFARLGSVGSLSFALDPKLVDLSGFGGLVTIQKSLQFVADDAIDAIDLSRLTTLPTIDIEGNANLQRFVGPNGSTTLQQMSVINNNKLATIGGFQRVTSVDGMGIQGFSLAAITGFDQLVSANGITVDSGVDVQLGFPRLASLQELRLRGPITNLGHFATLGSAQLIKLTDTKVTALSFPELATVGSLDIAFAPATVSIELPRLATVGTFTLTRATALESVAMPALVGITGGSKAFASLDAPRLPLCQITDLFAQAGFIGDVPSLPPCWTIDRCRLVSPLDVVATAGASVPGSGRLFVAGVTDQTTGIDADVVLRSSIGIGDAGTDPATHPSWTFSAATPSPGWNDAGDPGLDEYVGDVVPDGGSHDVAFRFSGDGGRTWTLCDRNGSDDGYQPANAGHVVAP